MGQRVVPSTDCFDHSAKATLEANLLLLQLHDSLLQGAMTPQKGCEWDTTQGEDLSHTRPMEATRWAEPYGSGNTSQPMRDLLQKAWLDQQNNPVSWAKFFVPRRKVLAQLLDSRDYGLFSGDGDREDVVVQVVGVVQVKHLQDIVDSAPLRRLKRDHKIP